PSNRPRKTELRKVVSKHAINVVQLCSSQRFLRLNNLHVVTYTRLEALTSEIQVLPRDIDVLQCNIDLAGRRLQIQEGIAYVTFNSPLNVLQLSASLDKCGFRLCDVSLGSPALPNGNVHNSDNRECSVRLRRVCPDSAVVRAHRNRRKPLRARGGPRSLGGTNLSLSRLQVRSLLQSLSQRDL